MDNITIIRILAGALFLVLCLLYFYPTFKAMGKRNTGAIFAVNLLTGWSTIGWFVALIWALKNDVVALRPDEVQQYTGRDRRIKGFIYTFWSIVAIIFAVAIALNNSSTASQPTAQQSPTADQSYQQQSPEQTSPIVEASPTPSTQPNAPPIDVTPKSVQDSAPPADTTKEVTQVDASDVRQTLAGWAQATNDNDVDREMSFYGDGLDRYFLARNVTREFIREDKQRLYSKGERFTSYQIDNVSIDQSSPDQAVASLTKHWNVMDAGGNTQTSQTNSRLWLRREQARWVITGEQDLK